MGLVVGAFVLGACSSGPRHSAAVSAPPREAPPTSASRPTTTTSRPRLAPTALTTVGPTTVAPAPGFHDTTPPPVLRVTGGDYEAIARSLGTYHAWLLAHHPDAALESEIYAPGTKSFGELAHNLSYLRTRHQTLVSINQRVTFTVASVHGALVTLRSHEVLVEDRLLDAHRRVVGTTPYPHVSDWVVVLTRDAVGRWRLADITMVSLDPTVVL